jgi:hypothetical protein
MSETRNFTVCREVVTDAFEKAWDWQERPFMAPQVIPAGSEWGTLQAEVRVHDGEATVLSWFYQEHGERAVEIEDRNSKEELEGWYAEEFQEYALEYATEYGMFVRH